MDRTEELDFYRTHSARLYNISLRIVRDSGLAEEIMQDTLLKFLTGGFRIIGKAQSSAWLNKTCIRKSIDALRRRNREKAFLAEAEADAKNDTLGPYEEEAEGHELEAAKVNEVMEAMSRLRDPYRLILNLVLAEGLDYAEIAELTGEKEGAIRTRYSRGRAMLLAELKKMKKNG